MVAWDFEKKIVTPFMGREAEASSAWQFATLPSFLPSRRCHSPSKRKRWPIKHRPAVHFHAQYYIGLKNIYKLRVLTDY
jgi:hypothetical protein